MNVNDLMDIIINVKLVGIYQVQPTSVYEVFRKINTIYAGKKISNI